MPEDLPQFDPTVTFGLKNIYVIMYKDDQHYGFGPFADDEDAAEFGRSFASNPNDDPRWAVVELDNAPVYDMPNEGLGLKFIPEPGKAIAHSVFLMPIYDPSKYDIDLEPLDPNSVREVDMVGDRATQLGYRLGVEAGATVAHKLIRGEISVVDAKALLFDLMHSAQ